MERIFKGSVDPKKVKIRKAKLSDISQLVEVENRCFDYDQLSRRSFHWMIKHAHSIFLVLEYQTKLVGYGLVLINKGTGLARLYSICTLKEFQGLGLGKKLLLQLEEYAAQGEDCAYMRLEVKAGNKGAIGLYKNLGYVKFTQKLNYYDDGATALCFEKQIKKFKKSPRLLIPYHQQGTDFTCGPSCLLMAIKAFDPQFNMTLSHELQIWREATTIFMTSGHGGCGPQGLALAAWKRGYKADLYLSHSHTMFLESVRSHEKKKIIELVQKDFEQKILETSIKIHKKRMTLSDLKDILRKGGVAIVLITTYHFYKSRAPHWVIVTAYDDGFVYIHDPDQEWDHDTVISRMHVPIAEDQFMKISRWGKSKSAATVVIYQ